jgi:hypothetical protein
VPRAGRTLSEAHALLRRGEDGAASAQLDDEGESELDRDEGAEPLLDNSEPLRVSIA